MNSSDKPPESVLSVAFSLLYARETVTWFFDRDGLKLRYEICRDEATGGYRLVITQPDGRESIEQVGEPAALIERSVQLMNSLRGDGWYVA